ncbi:acyl carrier protein [Rhodococcus sp. O3]|uniref:acyl carrier protein n=1 Tax=Rhodococcus sp. O3 TaxID=3404919 RepID=UPI003B681976
MSGGLITVGHLEDRIRERLGDVVPDEFEITTETRLDDLGLTSLQFGDLLMELEDELGSDFDLYLVADVVTVGELADILEQQTPRWSATERAGEVT